MAARAEREQIGYRVRTPERHGTYVMDVVRTGAFRRSAAPAAVAVPLAHEAAGHRKAPARPPRVASPTARPAMDEGPATQASPPRHQPLTPGQAAPKSAGMMGAKKSEAPVEAGAIGP